jgi:hypothetical protein
MVVDGVGKECLGYTNGKCGTEVTALEVDQVRRDAAARVSELVNLVSDGMPEGQNSIKMGQVLHRGFLHLSGSVGGCCVGPALVRIELRFGGLQ